MIQQGRDVKKSLLECATSIALCAAPDGIFASLLLYFCENCSL
uniref:Uncharacterized protein n=1 Tax=Meloidogyne enterolobii TaxID=390850 RepID=A0A6V7WJ97_MELEN|nr:unnamed protein product [Meloidogyne enterolobii]CAD2187077.1 unnamed protein product [Meloidogyne enterolobii]